MGFSHYEARNLLTGGFMAKNHDVRQLRKHVLAKAAPGKHVGIYAIDIYGGAHLRSQLIVPTPVVKPVVTVGK